MHTARTGGSLFGVLVLLLIGGAIGAGICYFVLVEKAEDSVKAATQTPAAVEAEDPPAALSPRATANDEDYVSRKLREWNLTPEELKRDLAEAGEVVRQKGREFGGKMKAATADVTIIAKIKAKYTLDDRLSALSIVVDSKDGHVRLSGTVASAELIGRAIVLALDTEGVVDVVSAIKVESRGERI